MLTRCHLSQSIVRAGKMLSITAPNTMHAEECSRSAECLSFPGDTRSSSRNMGTTGSFRLKAHRTVQTRPVPCRSVHHGIFPDVYFYTQSLGRPHERRPIGLASDDVRKLSNAWQRGNLVLNKGSAPYKSMLREKSLTWRSSLLLRREVRTVFTTPSLLSASHFKR